MKKGKKLDKVKAISCHVLKDTSTNETTIQKYLENVEPSGSEEVSSSDSDILIDLYLEQEESSHEGESSHEEVQNEFEELEVEGLLEDGGTYYKKTDGSKNVNHLKNTFLDNFIVTDLLKI